MIRIYCLRLALLAVLILCSTELFAEESATFKIGGLFCLSTDCAEWGDASMKGAQMAIEEINASGGVLGKKIELTVQDTAEAATGARAVAAYHKILLDSDIHYLIGPTWSVGGMSLASLAAKRKDLIITSPTLGVADFNETAENIFNVWPHDSVSTVELARYAIRVGLKRVAIVTQQDAWISVQTDAFKKEFSALGGEIVDLIEVATRNTPYQTIAARIKEKNPDFVFIANYYDMPVAAKRLRELKYPGQLMTILIDNTKVAEGGGSLEGIIFARYDKAAPGFDEKYRKRFGQTTPEYAAFGYDTVMLYSRAITAAKTFDTTIVQREILKTTFDGASGKITLDSKGGVERLPKLYRLKGSIEASELVEP